MASGKRRRPAWPGAALVLITLDGCAAPHLDSPLPVTDSTPPNTCDIDVEHLLSPDAPPADEAYVCYGFDAQALTAQTIKGLIWKAPDGGGVAWHHATLRAVPGDFPDGPAPCDGMPPGSVSLHVWAPGGDNLLLPEGTGVTLPETTSRLVVEMHVLRTGSSAAAGGSLGICLNHEPVRNFARFFGVSTPIPALRPHTHESASTSCTFQSGADRK